MGKWEDHEQLVELKEILKKFIKEYNSVSYYDDNSSYVGYDDFYEKYADYDFDDLDDLDNEEYIDKLKGDANILYDISEMMEEKRKDTLHQIRIEERQTKENIENKIQEKNFFIWILGLGLIFAILIILARSQ